MSNNNNKLVLMGASGHAHVVAEAAHLQGKKFAGYVSKEESIINPFNLDYLGYELSDEFNGWSTDFLYVLGIGDNEIRTKVAARIKSHGCSCSTLIHPQASVSKIIEIGSGTFIARNATINPLCSLGENIIVNTSASIDHECRLENAVHIAPGAVLAGNVKVGTKSFIGANSVIKEGIIIGKNVLIGAGSVVISNVADNSVIAGNPARNLKTL